MSLNHKIKRLKCEKREREREREEKLHKWSASGHRERKKPLA
jgi:hypothetical protein